MARGLSFSFRRRGQAIVRTAAGTINKFMVYMQVVASRKRAQSYEPGVVAYAKTEGELRAASGTDHGSHIKKRKSQKKNEKKNRKRSANPVTSASLSATGSSIIPK